MQNMAAIFMPEFDRSKEYSENFQFMHFIDHHH